MPRRGGRGKPSLKPTLAAEHRTQPQVNKSEGRLEPVKATEVVSVVGNLSSAGSLILGLTIALIGLISFVFHVYYELLEIRKKVQVLEHEVEVNQAFRAAKESELAQLGLQFKIYSCEDRGGTFDHGTLTCSGMSPRGENSSKKAR